MEMSVNPLEPPKANGPILYLPAFKTLKAIKCPCPFSPSRFSTGTFTFSKNTCLVDDPFIPSFFSSAPKVNPGIPFSRMNPVKSLPSILANTMNTSAKPALVIHIF